MLFNSVEFIFIFLPIIVISFFLANARGHFLVGKAILLFGSLFFYSWWNPIYLPLITGSILFNFFIVFNISKRVLKSPAPAAKWLLWLGLTANLSLLGFFKYTDFMIGNVNLLVGSEISQLNIVLPLAISFFTFQQIAYLVDSYRGQCREYNLFDYGVFVTFFPQLIAGPIVHHQEMMPQFSKVSLRKFNHANFAAGVFVFSLGLFKKLIIADGLSSWANNGYSAIAPLNFAEAWLTSLSYTFQLYFDFSGYSDMAIGLGLMFNIVLPMNFNSPYKAISIRAFWARWNMTLSRFLKDYLYIPLGGNRRGPGRTYINMILTMVLGGLWHGAAWTFVFWGLLHGMAIAVNRAWSAFGLRMRPWIGWVITFNFVNVAWVFFRAPDGSSAISVLKGMVGLNGVVLPMSAEPIMSALNLDFVTYKNDYMMSGSADHRAFVTLLVALIVVIFFKNSGEKLAAFKTTWLSLLGTAFLFFVSVLSISTASEFLYFNF